MRVPHNNRQLWWVAAYLAAALLLLSWVGPAYLRPLWDRWDVDAYLALNGSLTEPGLWQSFWVLSNRRYFDVVPAALLLGIFATWMFAGSPDVMRARLKLGVMMAVFNVVWVQLMMKRTLETLRDSPSLVVPDAFRIESLVDRIPNVKDHSNHSFTGDNAAAGVLVALIILHVADWKRGLAALAVAVFFGLPRLLGGGHWLTDVVIGGGVGALSGIAVFLLLRRVWPQAWAPDLRVPR